MLWWFDTSERDSLFVYDDGSSITCLNSKRFFLPGTVKSVSPVTVRNSSDVYSRIQKAGISYGLGQCYLDDQEFVNIICAHDVENDVNFEVHEQKILAGRRVGYDIFTRKIGITLFARWCGKVMIGSLKPLLDYIEDREQQREEKLKATANLKTMTKTERKILNSVTIDFWLHT